MEALIVKSNCLWLQMMFPLYYDETKAKIFEAHLLQG